MKQTSSQMVSGVANATPTIHIAAFYHFAFINEAEVARLGQELEKLGKSRHLRGLIIIAKEGVNGTICSPLSVDAVNDYLRDAATLLGFPPFKPKWSISEMWPFRKFRVRPRQEIVTLGKPEVQPLAPGSATHLSPEEWHRVLTEENAILLDTRNWYETRIGKFRGAVEPKTEEFHEFSAYLEKSELPKDAKILIYCTGGIRCEKAVVEMRNQGFDNVYQLDGGILNYLGKFPNQGFEGECFVFDNRVAVDQDLNPTAKFSLCPHCGQPADIRITCARCDHPAIICMTCNDQQPPITTCSKNCAHHHAMNPQKKGRNQLGTQASLTLAQVRSEKELPITKGATKF